jgi:hypothetical protein
MTKAFNERRRRGILVAPGVSPGTASSLFVEPALAGDRIRKESYRLAIAIGCICRPSGALNYFCP